MYGLIPLGKRDMINEIFGFNDVLETFFSSPVGLSYVGAPMKCDIKENADRYVIDADLPGVCKEDINISLDDGYLTISVNDEKCKKEDKEKYIIRERKYEGLKRSIRVNKNITKDDINAKYDNGVLTLTINKKEKDTKIIVD